MAEARTAGSLPVANVQVLAEACNGEVDVQQQVPERYLSKDPSSEEVVAGDDGACAIPVIDLRKLQDPQSSEEECAKLASACLNWGFFQVGTPSICFVSSAYNILASKTKPWNEYVQLINHGLPEEVTGNLMNDVDEFFKQPLQDKKECSQQAGSLEGYGQAFVVSDDQKLDWADMLYLQVHPTESRDLRFWPTRPASFR